jgi:signal transduction histidine kinase
MALVIIIMSYFNISVLENTLVINTRQTTEGQAEYITEWVKRILFLEEGRSRFPDIDGVKKDDIKIFLMHFEELRCFSILDSQAKMLFSYGPGGPESMADGNLFQETLSTCRPASHLWAYRDSSDILGEPIVHSGFLDTRALSYEYYEPILSGNTILGVIHISFHVKRLPRLLKLIIFGNMSLVVIFLVCTFVAISIWSEHAIKRPLDFILQAQARLAKGDFDIRVNLDMAHTNELARAYSSFNKMAEDLKSFRSELEKKNISLEELNLQYRSLNESLEHEVQKKTKELREFFSLITHDLKVPLAASQGYTDLLLKPKTGPLSEKQKKFLQSISMANSHLLHLVRNMLDSVKYDAGKINYFFESFELSKLADEVRSNLHLFLEERELGLDIEIPLECETVFADRMKIGQVLTNLISNAITVSESKEKIMLQAIDHGRSVEIRISDRGPGISKEKQTVIFDKFTQFPGIQKASGGMGLGLYIVKKILEGHDQPIKVVSEPANGSIFIFMLPKEGKTMQGE